MRWLVLLLMACEGPPVFATADKRQHESFDRIEGDVVLQTAARGNVVLFLFDAAKPPPPEGTGRPLTFATVTIPPGAESAPYAFSLVSPGTYLIHGLIDTNADFIPFYSVTADANAGDVGGAALHPVHDGEQATVFFSDVARANFDRPVFEASGPATVPTALDLTPVAIDAGVVHEGRPVFLAQLSSDLMGLTWPKVYVQSLTNPNVALAAGFDPTDNFAELSGATSPRPVSKLRLVIRAQALDVTNPTAPVPLPSVPRGGYSITLVNPTGQTWRVPNELAPMGADMALPPVASQSFVVQAP
jgi:hypothetical protein